MKDTWIPMTEAPCPRCLRLAIEGRIRVETVMPLPAGAWAPMRRPGGDDERADGSDLVDEAYGRDKKQEKQCLDCASAETCIRLLGLPGFVAARVAVGNDRQEQLRMPGLHAGLVAQGLVRPTVDQDALKNHYKWLERCVFPLLSPPLIPPIVREEIDRLKDGLAREIGMKRLAAENMEQWQTRAIAAEAKLHDETAFIEHLAKRRPV